MTFRSASLFCLMGLILIASGAMATTSVLVEAESYVDQAWNNNGGDNFYVVWCGSASQEYYVRGVDMPGDYIRLSIDAPETGSYFAYIGFQADLFEQNFSAAFWPDGDFVRTENVDFTYVGEGAGCEYEFLRISGSQTVYLEQGINFVQIEYENGIYPDAVRVDYLELLLDETPTASENWSMVKSRY
ncbi:hypothetical protein H8E52_06690 [bacterium]|nr:hypothetical protein [bacterium]